MVLAITIVVTLGGGSEGSAELDAAGSELGSSCDVEFPKNCLLTYLGK